jgi:hypothetical protein
MLCGIGSVCCMVCIGSVWSWSVRLYGLCRLYGIGSVWSV